MGGGGSEIGSKFQKQLKEMAHIFILFYMKYKN